MCVIIIGISIIISISSNSNSNMQHHSSWEAYSQTGMPLHIPDITMLAEMGSADWRVPTWETCQGKDTCIISKTFCVDWPAYLEGIYLCVYGRQYSNSTPVDILRHAHKYRYTCCFLLLVILSTANIIKGYVNITKGSSDRFIHKTREWQKSNTYIYLSLIYKTHLCKHAGEHTELVSCLSLKASRRKGRVAPRDYLVQRGMSFHSLQTTLSDADKVKPSKHLPYRLPYDG